MPSHHRINLHDLVSINTNDDVTMKATMMTNIEQIIRQ